MAKKPTFSTNTEVAVDKAVASFTQEILGLARKQGVDFEYSGVGPDRRAEILRTLAINNKVVRHLLKR